MKKFIALICILIISLTTLCACDDSSAQKSVGDGFSDQTATPYKDQIISNKNPQTFTVYVCGAVANEGYYQVAEGKTIADAVSLAGILPQTVFPTNSQSQVISNCQIIVAYHEKGVNYDTLNVNGIYVLHNLTAPNVPDDVIAKLHAYVTQNGKLTNKQMLKQILTEEQYQQNHYKFFVLEEDYATVD